MASEDKADYTKGKGTWGQAGPQREQSLVKASWEQLAYEV